MIQQIVSAITKKVIIRELGAGCHEKGNCRLLCCFSIPLLPCTIFMETMKDEMEWCHVYKMFSPNLSKNCTLLQKNHAFLYPLLNKSNDLAYLDVVIVFSILYTYYYYVH